MRLLPTACFRHVLIFSANPVDNTPLHDNAPHRNTYLVKPEKIENAPGCSDHYTSMFSSLAPYLLTSPLGVRCIGVTTTRYGRN